MGSELLCGFCLFWGKKISLLSLHEQLLGCLGWRVRKMLVVQSIQSRAGCKGGGGIKPGSWLCSSVNPFSSCHPPLPALFGLTIAPSHRRYKVPVNQRAKMEFVPRLRGELRRCGDSCSPHAQPCSRKAPGIPSNLAGHPPWQDFPWAERWEHQGPTRSVSPKLRGDGCSSNSALAAGCIQGCLSPACPQGWPWCQRSSERRGRTEGQALVSPP